MTRGDKIRQMPDKELCKIISDNGYGTWCSGNVKCVELGYVIVEDACDKCVMRWLAEEVESDA